MVAILLLAEHSLAKSTESFKMILANEHLDNNVVFYTITGEHDVWEKYQEADISRVS